jgi:outer membrane lipoprotein LolB
VSGEPATDLRRAARAAALRMLLVVPAFALAACATPPPRMPGGMGPPLAETFEVSGRFSARRGDDGVAGQFVWSHGWQLDVLTLSAPTGQALARLTGDAERVRLEAPDGKTTEAADWEQLTATALGVPIPVRELAYWMRGIPRPGMPHQQEEDAHGRVSLLRQNGWEIVYGYAAGDSRPARVRLTYPEVDVRLALDDWR